MLYANGLFVAELAGSIARPEVHSRICLYLCTERNTEVSGTCLGSLQQSDPFPSRFEPAMKGPRREGCISKELKLRKDMSKQEPQARGGYKQEEDAKGETGSEWRPTLDTTTSDERKIHPPSPT